MSLSTYLERLRYVDDLIRRKATGDTSALAKKLNLSRSHTLHFLHEMKEAGFPIKFSKSCNSYYYTTAGRLTSQLFQRDEVFMKKPLNDNELRSISGGRSYFKLFPKSDYIRL